METLTADQVSERQKAALDMFNALAVVALTPEIAGWLAHHDPKALQQVDKALALAGRPINRIIAPR